MSTIDQQFVEFIVKTLVNDPEKVVVERDIDERGVLLTLTVDPEDVGRVIGKRGATAQSLRTLLRVLGTKNGARYNLKIVNTDEDGTAAKPAPKVEKITEEAQAEEKPAEEPKKVAKTEEKPAAEPEESDYAAKARAELADLDDLDI